MPIKNIERELICPICKELFTHPLILPCQHSVCHKCVRELLMLNHEDSFDAGSECSLPGSPRSRVPSPSMERLDRLVRSGEEAKMFLYLFLYFKVTVAPMAASKCGLVSIVVLMTVGRCQASKKQEMEVSVSSWTIRPYRIGWQRII